MISIFTIAYNEEFHIQFMIDHYRYRFPNCNITIYDNYSEDDTVKIAEANGCKVIYFETKNQFSDLKHIEIKNNCWKDATTDWVLNCDMDELLDINEYELLIEESAGSTIIRSEGYNMVNMEGYNKFQDVKHGVRSDRYDKSYLFNKKFIKDINYEVGCHQTYPLGHIVYSQNIYKAYHYRFIDKERSLARNHAYSKRMSFENIKNGWGLHYLKTDEELMEEFDLMRSQAIKLF